MCRVQEVVDHVHELVQRSVYSWRTVHYDVRAHSQGLACNLNRPLVGLSQVFQKLTNGIL